MTAQEDKREEIDELKHVMSICSSPTDGSNSLPLQETLASVPERE